MMSALVLSAILDPQRFAESSNGKESYCYGLS